MNLIESRISISHKEDDILTSTGYERNSRDPSESKSKIGQNTVIKRRKLNRIQANNDRNQF